MMHNSYEIGSVMIILISWHLVEGQNAIYTFETSRIRKRRNIACIDASNQGNVELTEYELNVKRIKIMARNKWFQWRHGISDRRFLTRTISPKKKFRQCDEIFLTGYFNCKMIQVIIHG